MGCWGGGCTSHVFIGKGYLGGSSFEVKPGGCIQRVGLGGWMSIPCTQNKKCKSQEKKEYFRGRGA